METPAMETLHDPLRPIRRVVVRFEEGLDLPYEDGAEAHLPAPLRDRWDQLADDFPAMFPELKLRRLFRAVAPEALDALVARARALDPSYDTPLPFRSYFALEVPDDLAFASLAEVVRGWPGVAGAYVDPLAEGAAGAGCAPDVRGPSGQGHLEAAPGGVDARYAWGLAGGGGQGLRLVDLELGWTLDHEALAGHHAQVLDGAILPSQREHGTQALGVTSALHARRERGAGCGGADPACEVRGIAPCAGVHVVSFTSSNGNRPNAILAALTRNPNPRANTPWLRFGDVLLIEVQTVPDRRPIEVMDADYQMLRLATALGVVVVELAGNRGCDLGLLHADDDATNGTPGILDRTHANFRDSGAILVGGATSSAPHRRLAYQPNGVASNYGNRLDCYAWGENVWTSFSKPVAVGANQYTVDDYTRYFNGTSAAASIIAGVALVVQGLVEASRGYRFSPRQLRALLSDPANGTPSHDPPSDQIGVMPDLRRIVRCALGLVPDVYARDHVGDTGDPHQAPRSYASPDLFLRRAAEPAPQNAWGAGSGRENDAGLSQSVQAGQDHYVYVRVRNRGRAPATDVTATVYWAEPGTLLRPSDWHRLGAVTLPHVPPGDVLTVSAAIPWPANEVPGAGHYCLVGLVGNDRDPAPGPAAFSSGEQFLRFVRDNNNVVWRNFNVVAAQPRLTVQERDYAVLPFYVAGLPDAVLAMDLEVTAGLPAGGALWLEVPPELAALLPDTVPAYHAGKAGQEADRFLVPLAAGATQRLGPIRFPEDSRYPVRLLVHLPEGGFAGADAGGFEVSVGQRYEGRRVGGITWRLTPPQAGDDGAALETIALADGVEA